MRIILKTHKQNVFLEIDLPMNYNIYYYLLFNDTFQADLPMYLYIIICTYIFCVHK